MSVQMFFCVWKGDVFPLKSLDGWFTWCFAAEGRYLAEHPFRLAFSVEFKTTWKLYELSISARRRIGNPLRVSALTSEISELIFAIKSFPLWISIYNGYIRTGKSVSTAQKFLFVFSPITQ